ncbi:MAG: hypothetical protein WAX38_04275 [Minisyncoccia bacterium]
MNEDNKTLGLILSIAWLCVALVSIGLTAYLFLQGSSIFSTNERAHIDIFTEQKNGITTITGSIESMPGCERVAVETESNVENETLVLLFNGVLESPCSDAHQRIPFTASAPLLAPQIRASYNGVPIDIIQQK